MKTYKKKNTWKEALTRLLLAVFLVQQTMGTGFAAPLSITTSDIDLSVLRSIQPSLLAPLRLLKWRTGVANQAPQPATGLTFQYFGTGTGLAAPNRTSVKDFTANEQNDLWSDNVIEVNFIKGNDLNSAIVIYTANHGPLDATATPFHESDASNDPLKGVALRGGLVGCAANNSRVVLSANPPAAGDPANPRCSNDPGTTANPADPTDPGRQVILPLLWKAVPLSALVAVSTASVDGVNPLPLNSPLDMPTEVTAQSGGPCIQVFAYAASNRTNNGFCDFSVHFTVDWFNLDPQNLIYFRYATTNPKRKGVFNFQSVVGAFGINAQEAGSGGGGSQSPAYLLLGISAANAVPAHYGTTIYVESLSS